MRIDLREDPKSLRYKTVSGSESAHCCFEATVVDTTKVIEYMAGRYESICECFTMEDAQKICDALNEQEKLNATRT